MKPQAPLKKNYQSPTNELLTTPITKNKRIIYKLAINKNIQFFNENNLDESVILKDGGFLNEEVLNDSVETIEIKDITNLISEKVSMQNINKKKPGKPKKVKKIVNKHFGFQGIN